MSEEGVGQVVGQVLGAIHEAARFLNMPSSTSQVNYGAAVVLGVATVALAAAVGGIVYFSDGKPPWTRKKKHHPLSKQQWLESFESREGRLVDPERVISKARRGGINISIRAEVWPFLLGLYELNSTEAERAAADFVHQEEFDELRRQCDVLREHVTKEMKRRSLDKDDSGSFEKVNEAEVLESMMKEEKSGATEEDMDSPRDKINDDDAGLALKKSEPASAAEEPSKNPLVDKFVTKGPKALEEFRDWLRIIRLDAVRMNAEWVPYSAVQANVTEEEADKRADEAGIQDHSHLESSRTHHAARLVTILEAYALHDPETGYCQGMSDLLSPFVALIESDSKAFWCYVQFMKRAKDNFRMDETGIRRQLNLVGRIFEVTDPIFYDHLLRIEAEDCFFTYRMIVVLLRRELTFEQTICLWEVIWADWAAIKMKGTKGFGGSYRDGKRKLPASEDFLLFTIAAAVLQMRKFIIERCRGVDEILKECNAMAGKLDIWELIDHARLLLKDFEQKVGHEKVD